MLAPLAATLRTIARLEVVGLRAPRLTEPDHARWERFRRKLGWRAFIEILHEDLAGAFPVPFDVGRWPDNPLRDPDFTETTAEQLLAEAARTATAPLPESPAFLRDCARALGLPATGSFSDLTKVQPQHRVLELPGSGGRIAATLCAAGADYTKVTFVAANTAEHVAIGLAAVELRANEPHIITVEALRSMKNSAFDRVFGLRDSPLAVELAGACFPDARLV